MITYKEFMKHAALVTKNAPEQRPVLKGIKHYEDGRLAVTDSHRLYIAKDMHDRTDGAVLDTSGKVLEGKYPEVSRLIPYYDPQQELQVNVKNLLSAVDIIYSIGKLVDEIPLLDIKADAISFHSKDIQINIRQDIQFEIPVMLNAKYLLDALKLFKAAGCESIIMKLYSSTRPILLEAENLQVIIVPVMRRE